MTADPDIDPDAFVEKLLQEGQKWLGGLRARHRPNGRPLTRAEFENLSGYFDDELLETIRVVKVDRIENPEFLHLLTTAELPIPWDYSQEDALAVIDTILLVESRIDPADLLSVLFQKCVFVVQFQVLGPYKMGARYLHGLIQNGFNYSELPMQRQAVDLQMRFDAGLRPFSVRTEVEEAVRKNRI